MRKLRVMTGGLFVAVLLLAVMSSSVLAAKPEPIPAWYNDQRVEFIVVSENVLGNPNVGGAAIPLYAFFEGEDQLQADVLSAVPGDPDYNPWWAAFLVFVLDGRDVPADPYTSEAEILDAADDGNILIFDVGFTFLCQVLT